MTSLRFPSIAKLSKHSLEVFWLAGFLRNESNEWGVRVVLREIATGRLIPVVKPIGLLPLLGLGLRFESGLLQGDDLNGEHFETVVPDVGQPEVIKSNEIDADLHGLPESRAGHQRIFRYRTAIGDVLVPAVELIRALFVHNGALAHALMRPSGLEQLYIPRDTSTDGKAHLQFSQEIAAAAVTKAFAEEFAWIVLNRNVRRSWESVRVMSAGQNFVLFNPPEIKESVWSFRGVKVGHQVLVHELMYVGGRRLPFSELAYTHPSFRKSVNKEADGSNAVTSGTGTHNQTLDKNELRLVEVAADGEGTTAYRSAFAMRFRRGASPFANSVPVKKVSRIVAHPVYETRTVKDPPESPRSKQNAVASVGERSAGATLKALEFKVLQPADSGRIGDLVALEETARQLHNFLTNCDVRLLPIRLQSDKAIAKVGTRQRIAMVVQIRLQAGPQTLLVDFERVGIPALSLLALRFRQLASEQQIEQAVVRVIDGWSNYGGHWSRDVESALQSQCEVIRIPKAMIPRSDHLRKSYAWAKRLIDKLGLGS